MINNYFYVCFSNHLEFEDLKLNVEKKFSTSKNSKIVFGYGNNRIITYQDCWFAIFHIDIKFPNYELYVTKVLKKISTGNISLESLKKNKEIEVILGENKGVISCGLSQILKLYRENRD